MSKKILMFLIVLMLAAASQALAHTPLCSCWDNGDGTVTCEGGFSDGSSAAGVAIAVLDSAQSVIESGKMNEVSEFSFKKPEGEYSVKFDAGEGHQIVIPGAQIH